VKITNRRILLESHAINLQKMQAEIPLNQIVEIHERNTLGTVPNGILIRNLVSNTSLLFGAERD